VAEQLPEASLTTAGHNFYAEHKKPIAVRSPLLSSGAAPRCHPAVLVFPGWDIHKTSAAYRSPLLGLLSWSQTAFQIQTVPSSRKAARLVGDFYAFANLLSEKVAISGDRKLWRSCQHLSLNALKAA